MLALHSMLLVLLRASARRTVLLFGLALLQPLLGLTFLLAVGGLVASIPAAMRGDPGWQGALALVVGIYVLQHVTSTIAGVVAWRVGRILENELDDRVMALLSGPVGIGHLESDRVRDLAMGTVDGLGAGWWRPGKIPDAARNLAAGGLSLVMAFGVLVWLQWWLGLVVAVVSTWALYAVIRHSLQTILGLIDASGEEEFRRAEYERDAAVAPESAKDVRLFGFGKWVLDRWETRLARVLQLDLRKITRITADVAGSIALLALVLAGSFVSVGLQLSNGSMSLAEATVAAQALLLPLAQFGTGGQAVITLTLAGRPVNSLLELERRINDDEQSPEGAAGPVSPPTPATAAAPTNGRKPSPGGSRDGIRLKGLWFRYPGADVDVLRGVDMTIPAGTSVALVGANGAGKTTLVKLLCGFYTPTSGCIEVDGVDIRVHGISAWQRKVAAIFQDFARYPFSAYDNIGVGDLSAASERVEKAAQSAGIQDVLKQLGSGWETTLSRAFADGAELSGGQWQRVALARALLAAGRKEAAAGLLILDEPAANLDVRAEAELNNNFLELTNGLPTLVISHRFSTVRQADLVCVLHDGRIREQGSHDELLSAGGQYAEMFKIQSDRLLS